MVIRALDRKLLRDLSRMKMQAAAIALVVASGVALFVGMLTTYRSLRVSEHHYYEEARFAHVWIDASRAPRSIKREVAAMAGVVAVEGRIKEQVIVDVPGLDEPASAQLVSIPAKPGQTVNDVYLRRGRHVEPGHPGEVLVSEAFVEANHLVLGDSITILVSGKRVQLHMVGVALSPEYIMPVPPSGLTPDERRFGVLWMADDELEMLVDMRGAFNEFAVMIAPGTDEHVVMASLDHLLEPYGGHGAYCRDSQPSHTMLEEHIRPIKSLSLVLPTIFLLTAAFLVNIVLSRLVATQREQIGLLKAFGYESLRIALHYLELTLLVVLPGVALGLPFGAWLGRVFSMYYAGFFRFPVLVFRVEPSVVMAASLVAVVSAILGALGTLRSAIALPPVVAMTPEMPAFHRSLIDRAGLTRWFAPTTRMVLRNVSRRPGRSGFGMAGMSLAVAVVVLGSSFADAMDRMRDVRFQAAEREDVTVSLAHARAIGTVKDFLALAGMRRAEPFRAVRARLLTRGRSHDIVLFGLPENGLLRHAVDNDYRVASLPREGAVVTAWLAGEFGLHTGDLLSLEIRENRRRIVSTPLARLVDEPLGEAAYMELGALGRLLGEPDTYSGALLTVDPNQMHDLNAALKQVPSAMAVDFRRGALASYRSMSDSAVEFIRKIEVLFSVIIAFGVVYNSAKIALAERGRELATFRVLGLTRGEVSGILLGEVGALAAPAVPLGLAVGYWLSGVLIKTLTGERMHPPHLVAPATYAFAVVVFVLAAVVSALIVRRGLDRLDLLAVLKARE